MKPLRLTLQGFTCFRETTAISFEELSLFAISGMTGSGKSSILDAMMYALYGQTPRLGSRGLDALLNPQADNGLSVVFEFLSLQESYRVTRVLRKTKRQAKQEVRLEHWDGKWKQRHHTTISEANTAIEAVIGLDYKSFVRSVLLPQGAFDEFLRCKLSERVDLLIQLLNLSRVTQMQQEANQRARTAKNQMAERQKRLVEEFEDVTPEAISAKQGLLSQLTAELDEGTRDLAQQRENLQEQQKLKVLSEDLTKTEAQLSTLRADASKIEELRTRLTRAQAAGYILPFVTQLAQGQAQLQQVTSDKERAAQEVAQAQSQLDEVKEQLTQATAATARLPDISSALEMLAQVTPLMTRLHELGGNLEQAAHAQPDTVFSEQAWGELNEKILKLPELRRAETQLQQAINQLKTSQTKEEKLHTKLKQDQTQLDTCKQAGLAAKAEEKRVADELCEVEEALHHAKMLDETAHLKAHLKEGEPCPVCEQVLFQMPLSKPSQTAELVAKKAELEHTHKQAQAQLTQLRNSYSDLNATLKADHNRLRELTEEQETQAQALTTQRDYYASQRQLLGLQEGQTLKEVEQALQTDKKHLLASLAQHIVSHTGGQSPNTQAHALRQEREGIEKKLKQAEQRLQKTEHRIEQAELKHNLLQEQYAQAQTQTQRHVKQVTDALKEHSFTSAEEVEHAALSQHTIAALTGEVEAYNQQKRDLEMAEVRLRAELAGRSSINPETFERLTQAYEALQQRLDDGKVQLGRLQSEVESLTQRLALSQKLRSEMLQLEKTAGLYEVLASDLRRNNFPEYLLTRVQQTLARQASKILRDTTDNRYDLMLIDGEYYVRDAWNGGEPRSTKTLSGGETFITSLALALALSDTVAGNTALGALFLDEGFGSLDSETLGGVAAVLEHLTHEGRMVGVITHVTELTERLPDKLEVIKGENGSTVHWA